MDVTWQTVPSLKEQSQVTFLMICSSFLEIFLLSNPLSPLQERCVTFQFKFSTLSDIVWSILTANIQGKKIILG